MSNLEIVSWLFLGIGVGINIGLWLGRYIMWKVYKPLIEDHKTSSKYWFDSYMKAREESHDNYMKYIKELIK